MAGKTIRLTWQHDPTLNAPARYRRACHYDAYLPDPLAGQAHAIPGEVSGLVAEADAAIRELNFEARPALAPLARLLLRTESVASSKVEGLQVGIRELARAEAKQDEGGVPGPEAQEIIDNLAAMQLAVDEGAEAESFSIREITAIHRRLMQRSNPRIAGKLRTVQNWIGGNDHNPCGADFVPPPPEQVAPLLDDLCAAINDDLLPPLVQAALVHAQFETIHPFDDGNGRTGRALIYVVLRRRRVAVDYVPPISVVLARSRDRYIRALSAFRENREVEWIEHFAAAAVSAAGLAQEYLKAVRALMDGWRNQVAAAAEKTPRADAALWPLIDQLPAHPFISAPVAAAATRRSRPQIYQAIRQLEAAGVLIPRSAARRNQSWEAAGLLALLDGLGAGERPPRAAAV